MARLILFAFVLLGLAIAVSSVMMMLRSFGPNRPASKEDTMPKTFSTIAYVLLIILMFGIASGLLGAG